MTLQERFDGIIDCIEQLIEKDPDNIPQALATTAGMNRRLIGDAFQFMTDMSLIKYIRQRRIVNALYIRLASSKPIEDVAAIAGFSDAAAFSKSCKNEFHLSPSMITEDTLTKYPPLYFDQITASKNAAQQENTTVKNPQTEDAFFGVSNEDFAEIKQALEIGALYGFSDEEAEFVYRLAHHCNIQLDQVAAFYEDFKLQAENGSLLDNQNIFDLAELSCKYDMSYSESQAVLFEIECHGFHGIHELPNGFFDIYFSEHNEKYCGYDVPYICKVLAAMEDLDLSVKRIPEILDYAEILDIDLLELVENYSEYVNSYEDMITEAFESLQSGSFDLFDLIDETQYDE